MKSVDKLLSHLPQRSPNTLEENLKKALTELLVLKLLSQREYYIGDLSAEIAKRSNKALNIVFPYAAIYRIRRAGYIAESDKQSAPDGRLRQYYKITERGLEYFKQLHSVYQQFITGANNILNAED